MSLAGRYVIDRVKRFIGKSYKLPVPPYGDPGYWDRAYKSFGPHDSYEWGNISLSGLKEFKYTNIDWNNALYPNSTIVQNADAKYDGSLGECMGVKPKASKDQPILMLGCGNSKLGEEMIIDGGWRGPLIQVDVSGRVVEAMSQRCGHLIENGHMNFVEDDATQLSAFPDGMFDACIDKGMIDAVFCADEYEQCEAMLSSVHRVLKPGGNFVFLSFSRPEFLLQNIFMANGDGAASRRRRPEWERMHIYGLDSIMIYRFQKPVKARAQTIGRKKRIR
uniref:Methyltransferase domain-containing protein n=1 Tax=Craspedostauros australis TaxID=1486917 RepID=A0A7S0F5D7_9STRA|mmetsp:Transcript_6562/g.17830  ORF Transcript_6562/g.17830 Transcript_6562/m.17830 type:complete len:277 (+) Transcript_6562:280-1110(+)